jgi:hypothetical protein
MNKQLALREELVINKIYYIRGKKVMLDYELATLYNVQTKSLNLAVKRNAKRFPEDFMFQVTKSEWEGLRFQIETSKPLRFQIETLEKPGRGRHTKYLPYAFTEQGVAMLSSVLNSETAIEVNIQIIRIFTRIREMLSTHKDILLKLEQLERKTDKHDDEMQMVFAALKELINPPNPPRRRIGFKTGKE